MAETAKAKKTPEPKKLDAQQRFRRLVAQGIREGSLIALIALTIYLTMALVTFSPDDPGWAAIGHDTTVHNYAGRTGAWVASVLMACFGQASYLFPLMMAVYTLLLIRRRHDSQLFHWPLFLLRFGGFLLILLSASSLLSLYSVFGLGASSGGTIGTSVSESMIRFFNLPATTLVLIAIFLFALTVTTGLSWFWLMDQVGALTLRFLTALGSLLSVSGRKRTRAEAEAAANMPAAEPPLLTEALDEEKKPKKHPWWRRLPGLGQGRVHNPAAAAQRVEPVLKSQEPPLVMPPAAQAKPVASARTGEGGGHSRTGQGKKASTKSTRSPKITPFRKESSATDRPGPGKPRQASLLEDVDSPIPPVSLLDPPDAQKEKGYSDESLAHMSRLLEEKLADFGVSVEVVEVNPGPVITRFEIKPAPGVKVSKISNLAKDLARSLAVLSVRVVEVIPGKSVVGIEIPNEHRQIVRLSEVLGARVFRESPSPLTLALGNDIGGNPVVANLAKMPHLLVAGTTGSGKSVGVNAMLLSMLLKATPEEVRFIMVDPKMLELSIYDGIPHLLAPVVTDMKEAANALRWCVAEMERRYRLMASLGVRNIAGYNRKVREARAAGEPITDPLWQPDEHLDNDEQNRPELDTLPFIVVVIDEFADMMMIVGKKVEELIARIAQKARAAGIHLILATQRPSVDVITGLIKANIPTRISFQVSSKIDSRTVLDQGGAEQLLGHGDMLYLPPGSGLPVRVHGAFVDDEEVHRVVSAWKARGEPEYVDDVLNGAEGESLPGVPPFSEGGGDSEQDALYDEAVAFVTQGRRVSISSVQRKFKIGYNRAANLVEAMEAAGVVSPPGHNGAREVLAPPPPRDQE